MVTRLLVANLSIRATEHDLQAYFSHVGTVVSVNILVDRARRSRGIGFVNMSSETEASRAVETLDQKEFMGGAILVRSARLR
jgi:RNA recognition motif-containing protein